MLATHKDINDVVDFLKEENLYASLNDLRQPSTLVGIVTYCFIWSLIFLVFSAMWWDAIWLLPFTLIITGVGQRALGNLLHDASHGTISSHNEFGVWLSNWLIGYLTFTPVRLYKDGHSHHHNNLGDPANDPDAYVRNSFARTTSPFGLLWRKCLNARFFYRALLGLVGQMTFLERAKSFVAWLTLLAAIAVVWDVSAAIAFVATWLAARIFVFYPITVFREISEHSLGTNNGSIFNFTRNGPRAGLLRFLIHPLNNQYHLTHHLFPSIPWFNLPKANRLLMTSTPFHNQVIECSSYFFGENALIRSWSQPGLSSTIEK